MKATAITSPSMMIWFNAGRSGACSAIRSSSGRISPSFNSGTMDELATTALVYCAGLAVSAATWISWCSVIWLAVTTTVSLAHSEAPAAMA